MCVVREVLTGDLQTTFDFWVVSWMLILTMMSGVIRSILVMLFFRGVYNPYDDLPTMPSVSTFSIGDRVQTLTGDEGLVTRTDNHRSHVLITSHYDFIHVKPIFNFSLKPVDPWREALVEGAVV